MTDITKIAAACANRIFDRMEMCRGSAMLKSDIEREVEIALQEQLASLAQPSSERESFAFYKAETVTVRQMLDRFGEAVVDPCLVWTDPTNGDTLCFETAEDMKQFVDAKRERIDPAVLITPEEAAKCGIPLGAPGYVWVA